MTIDLKDPDVLKAIKEAGFVPESDVQGLKAKRDELLKKIADGKATAAELEEANNKLKEIEEQKLKDSENWTELENRLRTEKGELEANFTKANDELTGALIDRDLMAELVSAGVAPQFMDAVKSMHRGQVEYKDGKMVVGDKSLTDFMAEWKDSDSGKHFIAAPNNSGGNAPGGGGDANTTTMKRTEFASKSPGEQMAFTKEGGQVIDG